MIQRIDRLARRQAFPLMIVSMLAVMAPVAYAGVMSIGADPCPEPNERFDRACFLGPASSAGGYIDAPDDVDTYRLDLPPGAALVVRLGSLPAEYGLRLHTASGDIKGEAIQPGIADKELRVEGLDPGTHFLSIISLGGGSSADSPYLVSVAYPPSTRASAPPPARTYALTPDDLGEGFKVVADDESADGRAYRVVIVAPDSELTGGPYERWSLRLSMTRMSAAWHYTYVFPPGEEQASDDKFEELVQQARTELVSISERTVEPIDGWRSERVSRFWEEKGPLSLRGIVLKHRNAVFYLKTSGLERFNSWDSVSRLARIAESRIWMALP